MQFGQSFEEVTIGFVSMNDPYNCILLQLRKDMMSHALSLAHDLIRSAWANYNGKVKGILTAAQLRYIEGTIEANELVRSAWDVYNHSVHGPISAAQLRYL